MRRRDKEINNLEQIETILDKAQVCRIAMYDGRIPYIVPMNFGYSNNFLYFHSALKGKKIDILKKNNKVCFEVATDLEVIKADEPCKWGMRYLSVIGTGQASLVEDLGEKEQALNIIMEKYSGRANFKFPVTALAKVAIIKIEIEEMTGKKSGY